MATLLGSIVSLGLFIASAVVLSYVINYSAADELVRLKADAAAAQIILDGLNSRWPQAQQCEMEMLNSTARAQNCSDIATAGVIVNVQLLTNTTAILDQNRVASFNTTVASIIDSYCERIAVLQNRIVEAQINATTAVPKILQNGTANVELVGGDNFNVTYSVEQLDAGDLRMIYLNLPAWIYSLTTTNATTDPVIKYQNFDPTITQPATAAADINLPLLKTQSERFQWINASIQAVTYRWDAVNEEISINSVGTSVAFDTVAQLQPLKLVFQYL